MKKTPSNTPPRPPVQIEAKRARIFQDDVGIVQAGATLRNRYEDGEYSPSPRGGSKHEEVNPG